MNGKTNVTVSGGNDSLGGIIPLNPPTAFVVTADNAKCLLTWTDPLDKYADDLGQITDEGDQLVSQFAFTRIVRKEGGYPGTPDDGVTVTESSVRNQYQSSVYTDEGLTNNITYYYAAFTCNTDGVWSGSVIGSATPKAYDPILGNNTWEQINEVANEGIAASVWSIGDEIDLTLTTNETLTCVLLDFNHDPLSSSSSSQKSAITFGLKNLMADQITEEVFHNYNYVYIKRPSYQYLVNTVLPSIPSTCKNFIVPVYKLSARGVTPGIPGQKVTGHTMTIFNFSGMEVYPDITYPDDSDADGILYPYFTNNSNRIKKLNNGNGNAYEWVLRTEYHVSTPGNNDDFVYYMDTDGTVAREYRDFTTGICFGFCIGKTSA